MKRVRIDTGRIVDWETFHDVYAGALGFPDFYGRNMNAWIDCLTYVDEGDTGMAKVSVEPGELFILELAEAQRFKERSPELFDVLVESAALVN